MTEKRLYDYSELKDGTYGIFKDKYYSDSDTVFFIRLCEVSNEEQARTIIGQLNGLAEENEQLKKENQQLRQQLNELNIEKGNEVIGSLSEETIEQFKQDFKDGKFIEFTAR